MVESLRIGLLNWRDITHPEAGGAELVVHKQAQGLASLGHEVTLFTAEHKDQSRSTHIDGYEIRRAGGKFMSYPMIIESLHDYSKRYGLDVVIEHINGVPYMTPIWSPVPSVAYVYHLVKRTFFEELPFPLSAVGYCAEGVIPIVYRNTELACLGQSAATEFVSFGIRPDRIRPIPPGVDSDSVCHSSSVKSTFPTIIMVGPIKYYKRHDIAIRAFARLCARHPDAQLIVLGRDRLGLRAHLERLATLEGVSSNVKFTGHVDEVTKHRLFNQAWVAVYASSREGWGLGVHEAAIHDVPTVGSRVGGLQDTIVDGTTGLLYKFGDVESLTCCLLKVIENEEFRRKLATAARLNAQRFSWDRHVRSIEELLKSARAAQLNIPTG